ncbi:MAG: NAD(+)/NADH kinase [Acidobacteriota bacterium]
MRIGIVTKPGLTEARDTLEALERWLAARAMDAVWSVEAAALLPAGGRTARPRAEVARGADLVVVLGGDGTLLAVADLVGQAGLDVPILGVNFGSLGFLTEIRREEIYLALDAVLAGTAAYDERMMLRASTRRAGAEAASCLVLNDVVFTRVALSRMIDLAVTVGDQFVTSVRADGLIVASPTGSTAYNLAAGGPIVHPAMQALVLTPIAPHTLSHRPVVIAADRDVRVRPGPANADAAVYVTFDGQRGFEIAEGDEVIIGRAPRPIRLVRAAARSYFEVLREKLGWGQR